MNGKCAQVSYHEAGKAPSWATFFPTPIRAHKVSLSQGRAAVAPQLAQGRPRLHDPLGNIWTGLSSC